MAAPDVAHSGVSGWDPPFVGEDMYDWESPSPSWRRRRRWEPGTASATTRSIRSPGRRGDPAGQRASPQAVRRRGDRRPAGRRSRSAPVRRTGGEYLRRHPAAAAAVRSGRRWILRARWCGRSPARSRTPRRPTPRPGATRTWAPSTGTATRDQSQIMRVMSLGGEAGGAACCPRRRSSWSSTSRPTAWTCPRHPAALRGIGFALPKQETIPLHPERQDLLLGRLGWFPDRADLDRRLTIGYTMNRMAPGIIGSDRAGVLSPRGVRRTEPGAPHRVPAGTSARLRA